MTTPENVLVVRKIYPWLPAFGKAFTRAEPLTRIRDIAHRSDIPKELKKQIKDTLQNKLHRCAGPEDLATSSALLEKITAPQAHYSPAFVEAFKQFHEQLREFFNAQSLDERLKAMAGKANLQVAGAGSPRPVAARNDRTYLPKLINEFLHAKNKAATSEKVLATLELLTVLRAQFHDRLAGDTSPEGQERQLADIALEDFSFVLLGRLIDQLDRAKEEVFWSLALRAMALAMKNFYLSYLDPDEAQAVESELTLWSQGFEPGSRDHLLRLKATLDRARRLTASYCDSILSWFPEKAQRLGQALGVAEDARKAFAEAQIRSHLVFQISKGLDLLLAVIRKRTAGSPWDIIVPGKVSGCLLEALGLDALTGPFDRPIVAFVQKVEGSEDFPTDVAGIILAHEIPHLSHFAIRARQRNTVLVACEDRDQLGKLKDFLASRVILDVSGENVRVESVTGHGAVGANKRTRSILQVPVQVPDVLLSPGGKWLSLDQVDLATGGSKAYAARRLAEIAETTRAGFSTPEGLVIPFGVMEAALEAAPPLERAYRAAAGRLNGASEMDFFRALEELRHIIKQLEVPREVVSAVTARFPPNERLRLRSSGNFEDLEALSAAGLYESAANVAPHETAQGICGVWSSLWTRGAAMSRRRLGIPHDRVHMAVLIQEMLAPEFSFVMHTANPINHDPNEVHVELAVGLGETLASGKASGRPYRMVLKKGAGAVRMLGFASFSQAIWPDAGGGLIRKTVNYATVPLSTNEDLRNRLGRRLGNIAELVEGSLKGPQDIEGLVLGDRIYLVQSRPLHGS
jgi:phosphoglucan,water dikinase